MGGESGKGGALLCPLGHQETVAVSASGQGTKKVWKLTERSSWQESKGAERLQVPGSASFLLAL